MKTTIFKKKNPKKSIANFSQLSNDELNSCRGGLRYMIFRHQDGSTEYVIVP
jgi:hypothetical protein